MCMCMFKLCKIKLIGENQTTRFTAEKLGETEGR